jgi:uncharacterized protein (TIGR04255 family)
MNYLDQVIFRVDFTREIDHSHKSISGFYGDIKTFFPNKEDIKNTVIEASFSQEKSGRKISHTERDVMSYRFTDESKNMLIGLDPTALFIEVKSYTKFEHLISNIDLALTSLKKFYGMTIIKRTGLRYINKIVLAEGDPLDWKSLINNNLISMLEFPVNKRELSRSMGLVELNKTGFYVRIQFGIPNSEYPNYISRREFILDYDCYNTDEIDISEVHDNIKRFHECIISLYEHSILEGLRGIMG